MRARNAVAAVAAVTALAVVPAVAWAAADDPATAGTTTAGTTPTVTCPYHTGDSIREHDRLHLRDPDHARIHAGHMAGGGAMGPGAGPGGFMMGPGPGPGA